MRRSVVGQVFSGVIERGGSLLIENVSYTKCEFVDCALSLTKDIAQRATVRYVDLIDCEAVSCGMGPALLEDILVRGLTTNDLLIVWGALFRHVRLEGKIGKLKLNRDAHHVDFSEATQSPFSTFRKKYYEATDWALDISAARFIDFDFEGIPAKLVRRDPETQVVVTREAALRPEWRQRLSPSNQYWPFVIDLLVSSGEPDAVLVAPLGAPKKRRDQRLRELNELKASGVTSE